MKRKPAKTDATTRYIDTLDYGYLAIRYDRTYLDDNIIDIIELVDGTCYEVRKNQNGKLVAILSEEGYVEGICRTNAQEAMKLSRKDIADYWEKELADLEKLSQELLDEKII